MTADALLVAEADLVARAGSAGLVVSARAGWPETADDTAVTPLAGFVESTFSPLAAAVAGRALSRRADGATTTAVVLVTGLGDVASAVHVAAAVDAGDRVGPLLFFQSVPNAVAGYLSSRNGLTGPVVCLTDAEEGMAMVALLFEDGDADEALVVWLEVTGGPDRAAAVVVRPGTVAGQGDPA
jgi:Beta-ketoacyl synthase, N-terminal domain